jgi:hypothetical protein
VRAGIARFSVFIKVAPQSAIDRVGNYLVPTRRWRKRQAKAAFDQVVSDTGVRFRKTWLVESPHTGCGVKTATRSRTSDQECEMSPAQADEPVTGRRDKPF